MHIGAGGHHPATRAGDAGSPRTSNTSEEIPRTTPTSSTSGTSSAWSVRSGAIRPGPSGFATIPSGSLAAVSPSPVPCRWRSGNSHRRKALPSAGSPICCPRERCATISIFCSRRKASSSHILKFEFADYRHLPAYDTFTTQLAAAIDMPVMEIALRTVGRTRYDRLRPILLENSKI